MRLSEQEAWRFRCNWDTKQQAATVIPLLSGKKFLHCQTKCQVYAKKNVIVIVHLENDKSWYNRILTIHLKMKKAKEAKTP